MSSEEKKTKIKKNNFTFDLTVITTFFTVLRGKSDIITELNKFFSRCAFLL